MGAACCGGSRRVKRGSRMVSSATTEPLLRDTERGGCQYSVEVLRARYVDGTVPV